MPPPGNQTHEGHLFIPITKEISSKILLNTFELSRAPHSSQVINILMGLEQPTVLEVTTQ